MTYIAKWPISVISKRRNSPRYSKQSEYSKCYGYLDLDRNKALHLYFSLSGKRQSLRIDCSKEYLLQALQLNLSVRPIYQDPRINSKMWINAHPKKLIQQQRFSDMSPPDLQKKFSELMEKMGIITANVTPKQGKLAAHQFTELQNRQWKMDLISSMWNAEQVSKEWCK